MRVLVAGHDMGGINLLAPLLREWRASTTIKASFLGDPAVSREVTELVPGVALATPALSDWIAARPEELDVYLDEFFSTERFEVAICGTSAHSPLERRVLAAAKRWSVPSIAYCDMWWAYSERFYDGVELVLPDRIWVVDEQMATQVSAVGWLSSVAIDLVGSTLFADRQVRMVGSAAGKSVRFISEPASTKFPDARVDEFDVADIVARAVSSLGSFSGLVVRPHPTESMEAWRRWSYERRHLGVSLDQLPLEQAIADSSHALGLSSMLLAEMAIAGVRVASVRLPPAKSDYFCLPFDEFGISTLNSAMDVEEWLRSDAEQKASRFATIHVGAIERATQIVLKTGGL